MNITSEQLQKADWSQYNLNLTEEGQKEALHAAIWITCSPHEWVWTQRQQEKMARFCVFANSELQAARARWEKLKEFIELLVSSEEHSYPYVEACKDILQQIESLETEQ